MKEIQVQITGKVSDDSAEKVVEMLKATVNMGMLVAKLQGIIDEEITSNITDVT